MTFVEIRDRVGYLKNGRKLRLYIKIFFSVRLTYLRSHVLYGRNFKSRLMKHCICRAQTSCRQSNIIACQQPSSLALAHLFPQEDCFSLCRHTESFASRSFALQCYTYICLSFTFLTSFLTEVYFFLVNSRALSFITTRAFLLPVTSN